MVSVTLHQRDAPSARLDSSPSKPIDSSNSSVHGFGDLAATLLIPLAAAGVLLFLAEVEVAAMVALLIALNLVYTLFTAPHFERDARLHFNFFLPVTHVLIVATRWFVLCESHRLGLTPFWLVIWPLGVFESQTIQWLADKYENRPLKHITFGQMYKHLRVAFVENSVLLSVRFLQHANIPYVGMVWVPSDPSVTALLHMLWRAAIFDLGLDIGFYIFHRVCHSHPSIYKLVHLEHHIETKLQYGHLVAHETYNISMIENIVIAGSYVLGFIFLVGSQIFAHHIGIMLPTLSVFDMALVVSWAHTVELLGHSEMQWTPSHPFRFLPEALGIELKGPEHTMHHMKPLSNFAKRFNLLDRIFGTYVPYKPKDLRSHPSK